MNSLKRLDRPLDLKYGMSQTAGGFLSILVFAKTSRNVAAPRNRQDYKHSEDEINILVRDPITDQESEEQELYYFSEEETSFRDEIKDSKNND